MNLKYKSDEIPDNIINNDNNKITDINELIIIDDEDQAENFDEENVFNNLDFKYKDIKKLSKHPTQLSNDKTNEDNMISIFKLQLLILLLLFHLTRLYLILHIFHHHLTYLFIYQILFIV
jgi:hypothetical protein